MANDVKVEGGGDFDGAVLKNAATEATLRRLVTLLDKKQPGTGDKANKLYTKALEENVEAVDDATTANENYEKTLKEVNDKSKQFGETLSGIAKSGVQSIFSTIVAAGSLLVDYLETSFDAFKETNKVGANFNYDLLELRKAAAASALPLNEFVKTITENSRVLAAYGGTVTEGAKSFGEASAAFRNPALNSELYNMGYNMESLNNFLVKQLETEMVSGRLGQVNNANLVQSSKEYLTELTDLSKITGVSTDILQASVTQSLHDGRLMALQNKLTGKELTNFRTGLALMNQTFEPKVFETLTNMMAGIIDPSDKFGQMLALAAPGIIQFNQALGKGQLSIEDQIAGYKRQEKQITAFLSKFSEKQINRMPELKAMQEYLATIRKYTDKNGEFLLKGEQAQKGIIGLFSSFGQIITNAYNTILGALFDTETMKRLNAGMEKLAAYVQEKLPQIIERLKPVVEKIIAVFDKFITGSMDFVDSFINGDLSGDQIISWLKNLFVRTMNVFSESVGAVLGGLLGVTPEQQARQEAYRRASPEEQQRMRAEDTSLGMPDFGSMFDGIKNGLSSLVSMLPSLTSFAAFFGIAGGGAAIAGAGLAYGISAVGRASLSLIPIIGVLGAAIGFGGAGLGYMFSKFAESTKNITDFFTTMANTDSSKLKNIGESIKELALAAGEFASAGLSGLLTSGTLVSLADSLVKFSSIDPTKINSLGPALKSLHEGLMNFTNESVISSIGNSLTSYFSGPSIDSVISTLQKFQNIDLTKLAGLGSFSQGLKELGDPATLANFTRNTSNIDGLIESIKKFEMLDYSQLGIIGSSLEKFHVIKDLENIDAQKIENTVSAMGKIKTSFGEGFQTQTKDVDNFTKSVNNLVDTLKKLEDQMKRNNNLTNQRETTGETTALNGREATATQMQSINDTTEVQKQLNSKIDELITHIKEMKQNTKDTADSLSGRKSAL